MKKIKFLTINILIILIIFTIFPISNVFASDSEPSINATSAILIDNRTNKVLYGKNENEKMYPASTTKIMTAILSLENANLDDKVVASYDAVMNVPDGYSIANIQVGEELTIEQLLEVLLVHSANDAANVLAENIGGSVDSFVSMMNTKCNELGLLGTHFTNAYGLHDENHYTTASDLAKLMQYSLKNEDFRRLAGLASCTLPQTNMSAPRSYSSTNEMIIPGNQYYYQYITAGKTGFTTPAGECLISSGYKDNLELICVVLGCSDSSSRFNDVKNLYEYGFSNYSIKNIVNAFDSVTSIEVSNGSKETKNLDLLVAETIPALVKNSDNNENIEPEITLNDKISAPIEEGDTLGKVTYTVNGVQYTSDLVASHYVEKVDYFIYAIYIVGAIVVLLLIYLIFFSKKKR